MHIAWFRDTPADASNPLDDTAALIDELRATHVIDVVTEAEAHDFVWRHFLTPWDLCVYELDNTRKHHFEWGYLLNYPGVVMLKSPVVDHSWGGALSRDGRLDDYMSGLRFDDRAKAPPALRVPLLASRMVVVTYPALAQQLQDTYRDARVRYAPPSIPDFQLATPTATTHASTCSFGILESGRLDVVDRVFARACETGAVIDVLKGDAAARILAACDVVVSLAWPPFETPLTAALAGMAAGKAVIAAELDATADWPALDPQTWRPRGVATSAAPIAVTIDPRDEEHSLMLAIRRLASDAPLRQQLGHAAHAWWHAHATPVHAAAAWMQILQDAVSLAPPPRPADWPAHLGSDGTELARAILDEFGIRSDIR